MIVRLNLLPELERKKLLTEELYHILKREILFLLCVAAFVSASVWYVSRALSLNIEAMRASLLSNKDRNKELIAKVNEFNTTAKHVGIVQALFSRHSALILDFTERTPDGVHVTKFSVNGDYIEIEGAYEERSRLLLFRMNLENGFLTEIEFPIANLLKQEDGEFTIRGRISEEMREKMRLNI